MVRARLASLALAGSLLVLSGCSMTSFDFLRLNRCRNCAPGCECEEVALSAPTCSTGACPAGPAHPSFVEGPVFPPAPTPFPFPGATMPPATGVPRPAPLPPIVTVPQATPTPSPP